MSAKMVILEGEEEEALVSSTDAGLSYSLLLCFGDTDSSFKLLESSKGGSQIGKIHSCSCLQHLADGC